MRLTRGSDYALRVLIHLANPEGVERVTRAEIVQKTGAPPAFLNKLIQRLAHAGFLIAKPGAKGGCRLAMPAESISVLQVIETIDGKLQLSECLEDNAACPRCMNCKLRRLLRKLQLEVVGILSRAKIADLIEGSETNSQEIPLIHMSRPQPRKPEYKEDLDGSL